MDIFDNDLFSIQEARILAEKAKEAQKVLATYPQRTLNKIVKAMATEVLKHIKDLAILSADETDYGKWQDKYIKNKFICENVLKEIENINCVGIIKNDKEKKILDIGIPVGVIVALCPVTSPVSTVIYKTLIAIKSGNAIIFSPHPRARNVISKTLEILKNAGAEAGLPEDALSYIHTITKSGTRELINHPKVSMIMNTGIMSFLKDCYRTGKPLIFGGVGSGPAFVERTANLEEAAENIILSKSFDNGIVSAAEQSVVVDIVIEEKFREQFIKKGAYFMTKEESEKLAKIIYRENGSLNPMSVGKSPQLLAKRAGFEIDENIKILVSEQKYVSDSNPYSKEKLCPVLAYYVEEDWQNACEKCIELLLTERYGHTLVIHSNDPFVVEQFALKKPVGRMLVNTSATYGSMGATTNLFPAMTLGSGSAGKGITSDNVSPMNLVYIRKVGYGVKSTNEIREKYSCLDEINGEANNKINDRNKKEDIVTNLVSNIISCATINEKENDNIDVSKIEEIVRKVLQSLT